MTLQWGQQIWVRFALKEVRRSSICLGESSIVAESFKELRLGGITTQFMLSGCYVLYSYLLLKDFPNKAKG
jgi:hypothetical protein